MDPALAIEVAALARQNAMNEATARGDSPVQQFYLDTVALVTGGSGFLGKQFTEKLLRACPNVKKVYLLLRQKKGKTIEARLSEILKDPVYDIVRKKHPKFSDKLVPIQGDVTELGLGIKEKDRKALIQEVHVIFHAAATTRFDDKLKLAAITNVRGTREVLALAKECKKLRALVHISTAYSHATKGRVATDILEKFYPTPITPDTLIGMAEYLDDSRLDKMTPALIEGWPNTYTYTKSVSEELVRATSGDIPICIIRPSIVIATYSEPSPGWLDKSCAFGASGLLLGPGLGVMHVMLADPSIYIDLIPADIVNNIAIVAGWETARRWQAGEKDTRIYMNGNYRNKINLNTIIDIASNDLVSVVSPKILYHAGVLTTKYLPVAYILTWLLHYIPAYFVDGILSIIGIEPILNKVYAKAWKISIVLSYFTCNEWSFIDDNTNKLYQNLSQADKDIFNFDPTVFQWKEMMAVWAIGIRKYIIKDGLKGTDIGLKKIFWFKILNYFMVSLYIYAWWKFLGCLYWILCGVFNLMKYF